MNPHCCPVCRSPIEVTASALPRDFPFCSPRCRDVDLYRWCNESYSVPVETNRVAQEAVPPSPVDEGDGYANARLN